MIGFYDYTVVVTYISLVSSILGMFCAIDGKLEPAVFCLAFSGLCDLAAKGAAAAGGDLY